MKISFIDNVSFIKDKTKKKTFYNRVTNLIKTVVRKEDKKVARVTIVYCNDDFIRDYNKKFLGHDYETDIITFHDFDENEKIEGELLVSADTVRANSKRYGSTFLDEMYRVICHGILHLCGYNDKTVKEKQEMRSKENHYLKINKDLTKDAGKNN